MKQDNKGQKKHGKNKKVQLFKPRKKKSVEEDAAIQYLQAQYDKVRVYFTASNTKEIIKTISFATEKVTNFLLT